MTTVTREGDSYSKIRDTSTHNIAELFDVLSSLGITKHVQKIVCIRLKSLLKQPDTIPECAKNARGYANMSTAMQGLLKDVVTLYYLNIRNMPKTFTEYMSPDTLKVLCEFEASSRRYKSRVFRECFTSLLKNLVAIIGNKRLYAKLIDIYSRAVYHLKKNAEEDVDEDDVGEGEAGVAHQGVKQHTGGWRFMTEVMEGIRENIEKIKERVKNTMAEGAVIAKSHADGITRRVKDAVITTSMSYSASIVVEKLAVKLVHKLKQLGIENEGVVAFSNEVLKAILPDAGVLLGRALACNRQKADETLDACVAALNFTPIIESFVTYVVTEKRIPAIMNIITYTVHIMLRKTNVSVVCSNEAFAGLDEWHNSDKMILQKAMLLATRMVVDGDCRIEHRTARALDVCKA